MKKQKVLHLRPTQFAVGMLEVDEKIKDVESLDKAGRKKFVADNVVPVIRAPDGFLYVVDRHHFLCVCYHVGIEKVNVKVLRDLSKSKMSFVQFWKWMQKSRRSYPYCQFGEGPRKPFYLPRDIRGVADDPYRSLAWFVRKAGAFKNSEKNFAEFAWANYFRQKKLLDRSGMQGFSKALLKAVKLAQAPEARRLPGFGRLHLEDQKKARKKVLRKGKSLEKAAAVVPAG